MTKKKSFNAWLREADNACARIAGVDLDACGDGMSRDAYDNDVTPEEYAIERLEEAGFPFD